MHGTWRCQISRRIQNQPAAMKIVLSALSEALIAGRSDTVMVMLARRELVYNERFRSLRCHMTTCRESNGRRTSRSTAGNITDTRAAATQVCAAFLYQHGSLRPGDDGCGADRRRLVSR